MSKNAYVFISIYLILMAHQSWSRNVKTPTTTLPNKMAKIYNAINIGEQVKIQLTLFNSTHPELHKREINYQYSFDAPEQIFQFGIEVFEGMDNVSILTRFYVIDKNQGIFQEVFSDIANITKFQKIHKLESTLLDAGGSNKNKNYSLHIAEDFNIMVIVSDMIFPGTQRGLLNKLRFKIDEKQNSFSKSFQQYYIPRIDISQMHIPYKFYKLISEYFVEGTQSQNLNNQTNDSVIAKSEHQQLTELQGHDKLSLDSHLHIVKIHIFPYSIMRYLAFFQMFDQIEIAKVKEQNPLYGMIMDEKSMDDMKELLFTNNLYIVGFTFVLSLLKSILEIFALKNEIQIWNNIEKRPGLSIKILYTNLIFECIFILYLLDNQSNKMVIIMAFIGIAMTLWKLKKTIFVKRIQVFPYYSLQHYDWCKTYSSVDSKSVRYMYYFISPLFVGYVLYQIFLSEASKDKDIFSILTYSWILERVFAFLVMVGFIRMIPQLYINYKLKSVDHLPWKSLIYRFIETIIDDFFVFLVTTPLLHKIMVFRQDVIFLCYIYQRMIYKTDPNRIGLASGAVINKDSNKLQGFQNQQPNKIGQAKLEKID